MRAEEENAGPVRQQLSPYGSACETQAREHGPGFFLPLPRPRGGSLHRALGSVVGLGLNGVTCDKMFWVKVQRTAQVREHEPCFLPLPQPKGGSLLRVLGSVVGLELNGVTCDKIFWVKVQRTAQVRECGVRLCTSLALLAFC